MNPGGLNCTTQDTEDTESGGLLTAADLSGGVRREVPAKNLRIALLTPYTGHNLGDAAIQDAIIANLRLRLPTAQFSGITLNSDNFLERHGTGAFPLCGPGRPFYGMCRGRVTDQPGDAWSLGPPSREERASVSSVLRRALKKIPFLWLCLRGIRSLGRRVSAELGHFSQGYRFLRTQDVLIVSGGGQLDEEWGGPWGHPYTLFKWAVLARLARVPCAIVSVGACKINSRISRIFLSAALRLAGYRSYRDKNSHEMAKRLLRRAAKDSVVPDLAFSLPSSELAPPAGTRSISRGRLVVAISPIAYLRPGTWVSENPVLYDRYLQEMGRLVSQLLHRDYFLIVVWSGLGDDDRVFAEILERLDDESRQRSFQQMHVPRIKAWKDVVELLQNIDFLVASRLHSTILGFVTKTPTIAISFDRKVDWVMEDLGQTDYLLHFRDFRAEDVVDALERIKYRRDAVVKRIALYLDSIVSVSKLQYDTLAALTLEGQRHRNERERPGILSFWRKPVDTKCA